MSSFSTILIPVQGGPQLSSILGSKYDSVDDLIQNKITIYLPYNNYTAYITPNANIPETLQSQLKPVIIDTGLRLPIRAYQKYYYRTSDIGDPVDERKLLAIRSRLGYAVSETLAPDDFYVELSEKANEVMTHRKRLYQLFFRNQPCFALSEDPIFDRFNQEIGKSLGPLIVSTWSLQHTTGSNGLPLPQWYIREMFRDLFELEDIRTAGKTMIEGFNSEELYLFYSEPTNLTVDMVRDLAIEMQGRIANAINLKIFPRNTPEVLRESRQMETTSRNQWIIPYDVPPNVPICSYELKQVFMFNSLGKLFLFLLWLMFLPTFLFIQKELRIYVKSNGIRIVYETVYLPDYIRVLTARRVSSNDDLDKSVKVIYPNHFDENRVQTMIQNSAYLRFYDSESNEDAILMSELIGNRKSAEYPPLPQIEASQPLDFSLESRLAVDVATTS